MDIQIDRQSHTQTECYDIRYPTGFTTHHSQMISSGQHLIRSDLLYKMCDMRQERYNIFRQVRFSL